MNAATTQRDARDAAGATAPAPLRGVGLGVSDPHAAAIASLARESSSILAWSGGLDPARLAALRALVGQAARPRASIRFVAGEQGVSETAGASGTHDLVLVAGPCDEHAFRHAVAALSPTGRLALLGPPDARHDAAKSALREHVHIGPLTAETGSGSTLPTDHLWLGGRASLSVPCTGPEDAATPGDPAALPTIVNFYTRNTPYEAEVRGLIDSCRAVGWPCEAVPIDPRGSWERNCAYKAQFMREQWGARQPSPIVWLDADAVLLRPPALFAHWAALAARSAASGLPAGIAPDFAIHKLDGWMFASGTLYFGHGELAGELLDRWVELCEIDPRQWDQVHLGSAWDDVAGSRPLVTAWLPQAYTKIADRAADVHSEPAVVEHRCAARRFQAAVTDHMGTGRAATARSRGVFRDLAARHGASRPESVLGPSWGCRNNPPRVVTHLSDLAAIVAAVRPSSALEVSASPPMIAALAASAGVDLSRNDQVYIGSERSTAPGDASGSPAASEAAADSLLARLPAGRFDLVYVRDALDGLPEAAQSRALAMLRERATIALVVGRLVGSAGHAAECRRTNADRAAIYVTESGRAWHLAAWGNCELPEMSGGGAAASDHTRVAPGEVEARGSQEKLGSTSANDNERSSGEAALSARLTQLNSAFVAQRQLTEQIRTALFRAVADRCVDRGWLRIAIYGAGEHTRRLTREPWASRGITVAAIVDDAPRAAALDGIPIMRPGLAPPDIHAVVVSSDYHEPVLARRAAEEFGARGIPVLRIYDQPLKHDHLRI